MGVEKLDDALKISSGILPMFWSQWVTIFEENQGDLPSKFLLLSFILTDYINVNMII